MENKYIIKIPIKAEKHIKSIVKYNSYNIKKEFIKILNRLTKCHSCRRRRTYRQFFYKGIVTSVCKKCFFSRDPKTVNLIYSGKPIKLEEYDISDTNVLVETNFYFVVFRETYGSICIQVNGGYISYVCNGEICDEKICDEPCEIE